MDQWVGKRGEISLGKVRRTKASVPFAVIRYAGLEGKKFPRGELRRYIHR